MQYLLAFILNDSVSSCALVRSLTIKHKRELVHGHINLMVLLYTNQLHIYKESMKQADLAYGTRRWSNIVKKKIHTVYLIATATVRKHLISYVGSLLVSESNRQEGKTLPKNEGS